MSQFKGTDGEIYEIDKDGFVHKNGKRYSADMLVQSGKGTIATEKPKPKPQPKPAQQPRLDTAISPKEAIAENTAPFRPESRIDLNKRYDSSVLDLLSFIAPMAVDELEYHGLDNPGKLAAKAAADAALTFIPISKPLMLGAKAVRPLSKAAKAADAAYGSGSLLKRSGLQAAAGGIDNTIYQGVQDAVEQKDYEPFDYLRAFGFGALGGGASGALSLNKYKNYAEGDLYKKVKAKEGSAKQQLFDLHGRFDEEAKTNAEQTAELLMKMPLKHGLPMTWPDGAKYLDSKISKANEEVAKRAQAAKTARKAGAPSDPSAGTADNFTIKKPTFKSAEENAAFGKSIRDFLKENNLGELVGDFVPSDPDAILKANENFYKNLKTGKLEKFVPDSKVNLNQGITVMDAEEILKSIYSPPLMGRHDHDFRESLRKGMRKARGGDSPAAGSFGEAMLMLEKAKKDRQIYDLAAGGFGFGAPKNGHFTSFNKETRPQMGVYDFFSPINAPIRNSARMLNNVTNYVVSDKPGEVLEGIQQFGMEHPEIKKAFNALSLNAQAAVLSALESMAVQPKTSSATETE